MIEALSNGLFQLGVADYLWRKAQKEKPLELWVS